MEPYGTMPPQLPAYSSFCLSEPGNVAGYAACNAVTEAAFVPPRVVMMRFCPKPNSTSLTIEEVIVELSLAITLLEGWLHDELTAGKPSDPQNGLASFCDGLFQCSVVQRIEARLDLV